MNHLFRGLCSATEMGGEPLIGKEWSWPVVVAFTWVIVSAPFLLVWFWSWAEKSKKSKYNLPPSPRSFPVIGNLNVLIDSKKPLHHIINDLSKIYGPILMLKVGVQKLVFVSNPELTVEFLKTQDLAFANRPEGLHVANYLLYGNHHITLAPEGEYHSFVRRLAVTELLSNKKLQGFRGVRREEQSWIIQDVLEASARKEALDVRDLFNALALNVITRMAFNKKFFGRGITDEASNTQKQWAVLIPEMTERFGQILAESIHPSLKWIDTLTGVRAGMRTCFRRMNVLLQELLDEHKKHLDGLTPKELEAYEAQDFMDVMLLMRNGEHAKHLTDRSIKGVSEDLIVAGSDTSATLMEWALAELLVHEDVMKKVQEEVDSVVGFDRCVEESDVPSLPYLAAVVRETFRLHPPLPWLLPHSSRTASKVGGYDIPAGSFINFNVYGMSRDAALWENPLKFDPERFLNGYSNVDYKGTHPQLLPFGTGRRSCPGIAMSNIIINSTLARLLHSFDWSIPDGETARTFDMSERSGAIAAKKITLRALPTARLAPHLYQ